MPPRKLMPDDPAAVGQGGDPGATGMDQLSAVGSPDIGIPDLGGGDAPTGGMPVGGDTGGLSDADLAQIDTGAMQDPSAGADPSQDPELQALIAALSGGGTPQDQQMAQQMVDLAARRRMAGA